MVGAGARVCNVCAAHMWAGLTALPTRGASFWVRAWLLSEGGTAPKHAPRPAAHRAAIEPQHHGIPLGVALAHRHPVVLPGGRGGVGRGAAAYECQRL